MTAERPDDQITDGEAILWRRLLFRRDMPDWYKEENGELRPTSFAFLDNRSTEDRPLDHALSAYLASETDLARLLRDYPRFNVVSFPAAVPLLFQHTIRRVPEAGYDSHVEITPPREQWGMEKRKRNLRKTAARAMAMAAQWVRLQE